jgi:hypothetical protein
MKIEMLDGNAIQYSFNVHWGFAGSDAASPRYDAGVQKGCAPRLWC